MNVTAPIRRGVNRWKLCVMGRFGFEFVNSPKRLVELPMKGQDGRFRRVGWNTALSFVAERLGETKGEHGPDAIGGLASARCTNEENFVFQKFMPAVIGTNNVDHSARL